MDDYIMYKDKSYVVQKHFKVAYTIALNGYVLVNKLLCPQY